MNRKLPGLLMAGFAFVLILVFGVRNTAQAEWTGVDRDLGAFHMDDVNRFGDDRAYNSPLGTDRDADARAYLFIPETYGLGGSYGYDSGN